jgi:hypothetical protein
MEQLDTTYPWTLATGAWGDSLCAYGNICKLIEEKGTEKANVVYFGLDQGVCEFFKAQPNIHKVSWLQISLPRTINKYLRMAASDFKGWMETTELDKQLPNLIPTHISDYYEKEHTTECNRSFDAVLPPEQGNWADFLGDKYILFQPYSVQSCEYAFHWPHWHEALKWVLDNTGYKVVMAGELPPEGSDPPAWFPLVDDERVVNIVGQTKSMTDLLHIASRASLIVSTCNALSVWSILKKVPAIICCTKVIKPNSPYYYNWINHSPNIVVDHDNELSVFKEAFRSYDD